MRTVIFATVAVAAASIFGAAAHAAVVLVDPLVDGVFTPLPNAVNPGVYGVEARRGDTPGNATWELGAGTQTSVGGTFEQAEFVWGDTAHPFTLTWNASTVSITVDATTVDFAAPLLGDTLRIFAKRDATVVIDMIDGTDFDIALTGNPQGSETGAELFFYSADFFGGDGLTASGTMRIGGASGRNSASEIFFKNGDFAPNVVPEPGTLALLGLGAAFAGGAMRRRRAARV